MTGGEIKIDLVLDDKNFTVRSVHAGKVLSDLRREINRSSDAASNIDKRLSSFSTSLFKITTTLSMARGALHNLYDVFLALPASIIKTNAEIERLGKLMEGMSKQLDAGDKIKEAADNVKYLFDVARRSPFDVKTLTDGFVKIKSAGMDPLNGSFKALTDSVAHFGGDSQIFHRASIAIQQMAGKGVISMEELRQQLGEAVPTAMKMMATGMGLSMADLAKKVASGTVEATTALNKMFLQMQLQMGGSSERLMNTWNGLFARMKTAWIEFQLAIGKQDFFPEARRMLSSLVSQFENGGMRSLAASIGAGMTNIIQQLTTFAMAAYQVWQGLKPAVLEVWDALTGVGRILLSVAESTGRNEGVIRTLTQALLALWVALKVQALAGWIASLGIWAAAKARITAATVAYSASLAAATLAEQRLATAQAMRATGLSFLVTKQAQLTAVTRASIVAQTTLTTVLAGSAAALARVGAGVMALLGGPWGLLVTAIAGAIVWWRSWAREGEEAIKRVREAASNKNVTVEDSQVDRTKSAIREKEGRLSQINSQLDPNASGQVKKFLTPARVASMKAEKEKLEREVAELKSALSGVEANRIARDIDSAMTKFDEGLDAFITRNQAELTQKADRFNADADKKKMSDDARIKAMGELRLGVLRNRIRYINFERKAIEDSNDSTELKNAKLLRLQKLENDTNELMRTVEADAKTPNKFNVDPKGAGSVDSFQRKLARTQAESIFLDQRLAYLKSMNASVIEAENIEKGIYDRLRESADEGGLQMKGKDGKMVKPNDDQLRSMAKAEAQNEMMKRRIEIFQNLNKRMVDLAEVSQDVSELLKFGDMGAETTGMKTLTRQLAEMEAALRRTGDDLVDFGRKRQQALGMQSAQDLMSYGAELVNKTRDAMISGITDDRARKQAEFEREKHHLEQLLKQRQEAVRQNVTDQTKANQMIEAAQVAHNALLVQLQVRHAMEMRTPLQRLAADWENVTKQMQDAQARWGTNFVDMIVEVTKTGKLELSKFAESIATDIYRMMVQKAIAKPMTEALEGVGEWLLKNIFGMGDATSAGGAGKTAAEAQAAAGTAAFTTSLATSRALLDSLGVSFTAYSTSLTTQGNMANSTLQVLAGAANRAAEALMQVSSAGGGGGGFGDLLGNLFGGGSQSGLDVIAGSQQDMMLAAQWNFANGGIMTDFGAASLRRYAKGGIAKSPQLAMFGEGSTPEAYVPLPDGRSIPVTMAGSGAPDIHINVINQSGTPVSAQQGGVRVDGERMVLDVVLTAMSRPGAFRDGMKGALS